MPKIKSYFSCQSCGYQSTKWMGRCPECGEWNTFVEEREDAEDKTRWSGEKSGAVKPIPISEIESCYEKKLISGIAEFDRVLGGGIVPGSLILIGGDPGIGKSTLVLQTLGNLAKLARKVLYVSGEESAAQIKTRADRLDINEKNLWIVTENCLENLLEILREQKPDLIVIDSIQTIYSNTLSSAPGTVSQVRESAGQIIMQAKATGMACILVGHVTKEGSLAGPKVLEHMVDCVLYFESDQGHAFRILRAVKNRYGATNEIGVFEMTGKGLKEIANPSSLFLSERGKPVSGAVVATCLEGTRSLFLELQALVTQSGFANPRRTAIGIDGGRLALLVAVLEKIVGLTLHNQDIFVNVAGGLRVTEPALDLGVSAAIFSSFRNLPIHPKTILIGEVGLTGEIRPVSLIDVRLKEAAKLGFTDAYIPQGNFKKQTVGDLNLYPVQSLEEFLHKLF
ncbi:MAG: DNA repair protein RadA [Nitrospinae bacterium RIFCSPLOWO2_02_39_17]|nr:MAG: DNA repair protein RadA [Nitrospinae bacterium RIFCSPLOWO2_02_39_17]